MSLPLLIFVVVVAGLVIGSFLTVVVDRVPRGGSVMAPPSRCGSCGLRLGPLDLVPVVSWVALRGKCRHCGAPIGIEPIVIELATAGIFVLFGAEVRGHGAAPGVLHPGRRAGGADLDRPAHPAAAPRDHLHRHRARRHRPGDRSDRDRRARTDLDDGRSAPASRSSTMGLIYVASKGGMGDGDVRLAPLLGMYLG